MADYTPHTWTSGETITANKMNHIEQGIGSGGGIFWVGEAASGTTRTLDKTAGEIFSAINSGKLVFAAAREDRGNDMYTAYIDCLEEYGFGDNFFFSFWGTYYYANSENDYPCTEAIA